ncbi:MAG: hypothetical protein ACRDNI_11555 [Gaiellaceae bacterium]
MAVSATIFGFGFAPEAHHEEPTGEHAEAVEEGGEEAEAEGGASHAEEEEAEGATAGAIASSILISLAGVALVPLALMPARRRQVQVGLAAAVGAASVVALLSIGASTVHFAVIAQHFDEWWLTGMFFLTIALFQLGWGLLVLLRPSALVYLAGAIVNALIVVTWIVSRTTGVPVGPEAGEAEPVGFPDTLSTAFEVVLVIVVVALLADGSARRPAWHLTPAAGLVSAAVVASLTALALVILA